MAIQVSDWNDLRNIENDLTADYVLTNNIDKNSAGYGTEVNTADGWTPIENFDGTFDGQENEIKDLFIDRSSQTNVGLFADVDSNAEISNIRLKGVDVSGDYRVGGLVGENSGTIKNTYVTGVVSAEDENVGGVAGENTGGTITQSYSAGSVSGNDDFIGGLVGHSYNSGTITESYSTADVSGSSSNSSSRVGGLVGENDSEVANSYARGDVTEHFQVGGLVGYNYGTITESYSTGSVSGDYRVGGLVGYNYNSGAVTDSYWDTETSGQSGSDGGTGLTTDEMTGDDAPDNMTGFDFDAVWE